MNYFTLKASKITNKSTILWY